MINRFTYAALAMVLGAMPATVAGAELFSYSLSDGNSGLRLAWRADSTEQWQPLGGDWVRNDFGPWGSHKKMFSPRLFHDASDGNWVATWSATKDGSVTARAVSPDLIRWLPQTYYASSADLPRTSYPAAEVTAAVAAVDGNDYAGYVQKVPSELIESLREHVAARRVTDALHAERATDDATRYAGLTGVKMTVSSELSKAYPISDMLTGIFFEDINYGADGGLYAELIQNRDFEYAPSDRGNDSNWNATKAWSSEGKGRFDIVDDRPVHPNNRHYAHIEARGDFTVANEGFDSIAVVKGKTYNFSVMASVPMPVKMRVSIVDKNGHKLASRLISLKGFDWKTYTATLRPSESCTDAALALSFGGYAVADIDMVSLFPSDTFRGRKNGLRADLAQKLADIHPRFVRFPGGCVAHGDGIDNIYDWKGSVGPLEARKPLRNLWGYHQTRGLGYHEYFLFCEDIGAEPLPVLAAGVPCQNSGSGNHAATCDLERLGQQNGVPMDSMFSYIQDVLDLIEYANGPADSEWGALRAAAGHPEPFNLKYVGIGNEDLISEVFESRFRMIYDAVRRAHPEITVVGTVGPFYEGSDYDAGWKLARELQVPVVDEHYYVSPGWLINNRDFYDKYERHGTKVYLGEYASHIPGRANNIETALSDALYLTDVERNGDIVAMTSYAPLLAKNGHTQWRPDMIYFDNVDVYPTPEYYVQRLYGQNSGDRYIPTALTFDSSDPNVTKRIGVSVTEDTSSGRHIVKIVNMLPVPLEADLASLGIRASKVNARQLSGDIADEHAAETAVTLSLPDATLPPYSFTVFTY